MSPWASWRQWAGWRSPPWSVNCGAAGGTRTPRGALVDGFISPAPFCGPRPEAAGAAALQLCLPTARRGQHEQMLQHRACSPCWTWACAQEGSGGTGPPLLSPAAPSCARWPVSPGRCVREVRTHRPGRVSSFHSATICWRRSSLHRIPVTGALELLVGFSPAMLRARWHFPGVGVLGTLVALSCGPVGFAGAPQPWSLVVSCWHRGVGVTGGFHEDGLAGPG